MIDALEPRVLFSHHPIPQIHLIKYYAGDQNGDTTPISIKVTSQSTIGFSGLLDPDAPDYDPSTFLKFAGKINRKTGVFSISAVGRKYDGSKTIVRFVGQFQSGGGFATGTLKEYLDYGHGYDPGNDLGSGPETLYGTTDGSYF